MYKDFLASPEGIGILSLEMQPYKGRISWPDWPVLKG
jgi:hypothetical protein